MDMRWTDRQETTYVQVIK